MQDFGAQILQAATRAANRQADLRQAPRRTTREDLEGWARRNLSHSKLVVVSNREPYSHIREGGGIKVVRNAGGLTVALDAVAQALGGVWVAYGSGDADRERSDANGRLDCPPADARYTLRRVFLSPEDHALYYSGLANAALWPLCHIAFVRPRFALEEWERYRDVNRRFAEAVLEEVGNEPAVVFLQDYHLALVAKFLKERRPDLQVAQFWHIPWPNAEVFRIFPWKAELLQGLLANDLLGFHLRAHTLNFLDSVADTLEALVNRENLAVDRAGRRTWVRHFPMGIHADEIAGMAESLDAREAEDRIRKRLGLEGCKIAIGVDRMDYTKGIPERLQALERLFVKYPEWRGRLAFIQIAVPSRAELPEYRENSERVRALVERINSQVTRAGGPTVNFIEAHFDFDDLVPYYRMADLCAVTSLHDGMNLVAKEYVAATPDLDGALVLSTHTGAARELERAWMTSPYDIEGLADAYHQALIDPVDSRRERMAALRETVLRRNIFDWAIDVFDALQRLTLRTPATDGSGS